MRQFPQSLSSRLLIAFTLISLITVLGLGTAAYISERRALTYEVKSRLNTIARLKEEQLTTWLENKRSDLALLSENDSYRKYIMMIASSEVESSTKLEYANFLRDNLSSITKSHPTYTRVELLDPDGQIIASTDLGRPLGLGTNMDFFRSVLSSPSGYFTSEIFTHPETGQAMMQFGRVIYEFEPDIGTRTPAGIGVAIIDVELESSFFRLVNSWPDRGETGEIILGQDSGNELLVLNSLRPLPSDEPRVDLTKSPDSPLYKAILGASGVGLAEDKRGVGIIAAYRPIADAGWGLVVKLSQREAFLPIRRFTQQLVGMALLTLLVAWTSAYIIWRRIANPLSNLIDATQEVINDNYAVDIEVTHDDEIGMLTNSFKQMVETLDRRRKELQMANRVVNDTALTNTRLVAQLRGLNSELEGKVYERTKELSEANDKLKHLDQLKSKFISNVSHELRNPVASLKLYLRLLEKSNDQNRERYIAGIGNQIEWLGKLIETILDLTQLERGIDEMEFSRIDLQALTNQVYEIYKPIAEDSQLELTYESPSLPLIIAGSENKLTQMLTNLLANAVNYTPTGSIAIELRQSPEEAILSIEDTGIGIDEEDIPHLFERFYRGKNTHELEIRGTGLGLGIVKEIMDLHHGRLEVQSRLGEGSRFVLIFPLSHPIQHQSKKMEPQHRNQMNTKAAMLDIWPKDAEEADIQPEQQRGQ